MPRWMVRAVNSRRESDTESDAHESFAEFVRRSVYDRLDAEVAGDYQPRELPDDPPEWLADDLAEPAVPDGGREEA